MGRIVGLVVEEPKKVEEKPVEKEVKETSNEEKKVK